MNYTDKLDLENWEEIIFFLECEVRSLEMGSLAGFDDDIEFNLQPDDDSLEESLNKYDKVFIQLGYWGYEYETSSYIFDEEAIDTSDIDSDSYYERYHYSLAGYGIFLDKNFDYEYGYLTEERPCCGHGPGIKKFHDFKDTRKDDEIRDIIIEASDGILYDIKPF